jgi:hypothetical protein
VTLLANGAALATVTQARAESGVGGLSAQRRRIHFLSLVAGLAGRFALEGALYRAGASRAVIGVFEAAAPILVAGLFYLASSALRLDWAMCALGVWLVAVAAGSRGGTDFTDICVDPASRPFSMNHHGPPWIGSQARRCR